MKMDAMWYLAVFLSALAVDFIPVIAPPAWTIMVFLLVKFHLNPWFVLLAGVSGSTLGRYLMSLCVPKFSHLFLKRRKHEELEFVGKKLSEKLWHSWLFVFLYTITPLSSTALFTAAAIAKVKAIRIVPPFFCGKLVTDAIMLLVGRYAVESFTNLVHGAVSLKAISTLVFGFAVISGLLFLDGRALLQNKRFAFNFKIWK
jgi:membrane protein YqaA with SNARE-associated domain